jgi:Ca2+-binding RTX toxin-like protein
VGKTITVTASYTDSFGVETVNTAATNAVVDVNDPPIWNGQALPTNYIAHQNLGTNTPMILNLTTLRAALLPYFYDPEGKILELDLSNLNTFNGSISVTGNSLEFIPTINMTGAAQITLDISDGVNPVPIILNIDVLPAQVVVDSTPVTLAAGVLDATIITAAGGDITGNELDNFLTGFTGIDILNGGAGNDTLNGYTGADTMNGGDGNDFYYVDNLLDTVTDTSGIDTVQTTLGVYALASGLENLTLAGVDVFQVGLGNDANNLITGSSQNDQLFGGLGNDTLTGGAGQDVMEGGAGADTFVFQNQSDSTTVLTLDRLLDFTSGQDKIDLSGIDANLLAAGDQAFTFINSAAFSHTAGELRFSDWTLSGDTNGDGLADFSVKMIGVETLFQNDIIL